MSHILSFSFWFGVLMLIAGGLLFWLGWMGKVRLSQGRSWLLHKGPNFSIYAGILSIILGVCYVAQPGMPISLHIAAVLAWSIMGAGLLLGLLTPVRFVGPSSRYGSPPSSIQGLEDDVDE